MVLQNGYVTGSLFGPEWKYVREWPQAGPSRLQGESGEETATAEEAAEEDEFEDEVEEIYVTLDLGPNADPLTLGTGTDYQLIGLDTATPFLKIGNDVFRGTPQQLIGSEIITKDTRDPQNPIKHSHPAIAHTNHRIAFEPVKLVPRASEPTTPGKSVERPPMFARDVAAPAVKPPAKTTRKKTQDTIVDPPSETPEASGSTSVPDPIAASSRRRKAPANSTIRSNPLSSRYIIPTHGEISADGIPRIEGQVAKKTRKSRGPKKTYNLLGVTGADAGGEGAAEASAQPMMVYDVGSPMRDVDDASGVAGPSSPTVTAATPEATASADDAEAVDAGTLAHRILVPDAPRGYTRFGLPRKKPGPAKGQRKSTLAAKAAASGGVMGMLTGMMPGEGEGEASASGAQAVEQGDEMDVDRALETREAEAGGMVHDSTNEAANAGDTEHVGTENTHGTENVP